MDNLIKFAIKQPIAVAAMVFLIIAFGFVSLQKIPIQMTPDIDKPVLQVRVSWPGASPKDVEREVVTRVELAVSSLTGVETVESDSRFGSARVTLTYSVGQDMDIALVQLLSKVSSIDGLPFDAKRPTVRTSNSDDSPISRLAMIKLPGSKVQDLGSLGDFVEYEIIEKLSRIEGVSEITFRGGQRKELKVALDSQDADQIMEAQDKLTKLAVENEKKWADYLFSNGSLLGLNAEMLNGYIEWLANTRLRSLGFNKIFDQTTNPIGGWLNGYSDSSKVQVAPQETEISSYKIGARDTEIDEEAFDDVGYKKLELEPGRKPPVIQKKW